MAYRNHGSVSAGFLGEMREKEIADKTPPLMGFRSLVRELI
jgi:hypothetical protein